MFWYHAADIFSGLSTADLRHVAQVWAESLILIDCRLFGNRFPRLAFYYILFMSRKVAKATWVQCTSVLVAGLPSIPDFSLFCLRFPFGGGGRATPFNIRFLPGPWNFSHPVHSFQQCYELFSQYLIPTTISSPVSFISHVFFVSLFPQHSFTLPPVPFRNWRCWLHNFSTQHILIFSAFFCHIL